MVRYASTTYGAWKKKNPAQIVCSVLATSTESNPKCSIELGEEGGGWAEAWVDPLDGISACKVRSDSIRSRAAI